MSNWNEISWDDGSEYDPVNPDRFTIELAHDGTIRVTHRRGRARRDWVGKQAESLWPSVIAALEKAGFPRQPEQPKALVPGTSTRTVRARSTTGEDFVVRLTSSVAYRDLSMLMMTILGQTSEDILGFEMPEAPRLITDIVLV